MDGKNFVLLTDPDRYPATSVVDESSVDVSTLRKTCPELVAKFKGDHVLACTGPLDQNDPKGLQALHCRLCGDETTGRLKKSNVTSWLQVVAWLVFLVLFIVGAVWEAIWLLS